MWIESLSIQGFKSFRDRAEIQFDRNHTAVIGFNGSGKSSMLSALAFLLQPMNRSQMKDNAGLLHEIGIEGDHPKRVLTSIVEIVINNEDHRLPIESESDRVKLTWTLGTKKDVLHINGKPTPIDQWKSTLKSAGMLRENFFFIHQGETNRLAMATPVERIKMLEKFAGADEWEKDKEKVAQDLDECTKSLEEFDIKLEELDGDLDNLSKDNEETEKFIQLDKNKRALAHILLKRETSKTQEKLFKFRQENDSAQKEFEKKMLELRKDFMEEHENCKLKKSEKEDAENILTSKKSENENLREELENQLATIQKMEYEIERNNSAIEKMDVDQAHWTKEKENLENRAEDLREQIKIVDVELVEKQARYDEIEENIVSRQNHLKIFNEHRGRRGDFTSEKEKNQWLESDIENWTKRLDETQKSCQEINDMVKSLTNEQSKTKALIEEKKAAIDEVKEQTTKLYQEQSTLNDDTLTAEYSMIQAQIIRKQAKLDSLKTSKNDALIKLKSKPYMRQIFDGDQSIQKVLQHLRSNNLDQHLIDGYLGMAASFLDCEKKMELAISVAIGNKMFNHIVTSAYVATQILSWMKKLGFPGEPIFMPLDKLMVHEFTYPEASNVKPLINLVQFPEQLELAYRHLFYRKMLIRDLENFAEIRQSKVDVVTLDGQQQSGKGFMTGGFYNSSEAKLTLFKAYEDQNKIYENEDRGLKELDGKREQILSKLAHISEGVNKITAKMQYLKKSSAEATMMMNVAMKESKQLELRLEKYQNDGKTYNLQVLEYQTRIKLLQDDLNGVLDGATQQEQIEMYEIAKEVEVLKTNMKKMFKKTSKLQTQKETLRNELENDVLRSLKESNLQLGSPGKLDFLKKQLRSQSENKAALRNSIIRMEDTIAKNIEKMKELSDKVQKTKETYQQLETAVWSKRHKFDEFMSKHYRAASEKEKNLLNQMKDCDNRLLEQGTIPNTEVQKFEKLKTKQCEKELENVQKQLEKIERSGKVNLKSQDLYDGLLADKKQLEKRRSNMATSVENCSALYEAMENSSNTKIEFTFRQVAKYFEETFKILVPNGHGRMTFHQHSSASETDEIRHSSVSVHVSFDGGEEMSELNQLSGGQKSIVALAYMFALQKTDPSPIYIFDEIDAHLDTNSRKRIAQWFLSSKTTQNEDRPAPQYITTTFRQELVQHADKVLGVMMKNSASRVQDMTLEDAMEFIVSQQY